MILVPFLCSNDRKWDQCKHNSAAEERKDRKHSVMSEVLICYAVVFGA